MAWFLQSTKAPDLHFRIVKLDRTTMRATLQGPAAAPFERDISQATLDKYGYRIIKVEDPPKETPT